MMTSEEKMREFEALLSENEWMRKLQINLDRDGTVYPYKYDTANFLYSMYLAALRTHENGGQEREAGAVYLLCVDTRQGLYEFVQPEHVADLEEHVSVEKYFTVPQSAQAIETAAIMKCAEVADAPYQRDKPLQQAGGQDNSDGYVTGYVDGCGDCGHAIRNYANELRRMAESTMEGEK